MKAVKYLGPDNIQVVPTDVPTPDSGEALVKVHLAGICGTDMAIIGGKHPRARPPLIPGHEFAGQVVDIRPGGTPSRINIGDRVTAYPLISCGQCWSCRNGFAHVCSHLKLIGIDTDGFMAEYARVPINHLYQLPATLSFEKGALIEPLAVGIHAVAMAQPKASDFCVVMGAGPIGLMVGLRLHSLNIQNIVITDLNNYRLQLADELGLQTLDISRCDPGEEVLSLTDRAGADIVFEAAGSKEAAMQMSQLVRCRGKVILVSVHKEPHKVNLQAINFKEISIIGSRVYSPTDYEQALKLAAELSVERLISHKVPIAQGAKAFGLVKESQDVAKVVISME